MVMVDEVPHSVLVPAGETFKNQEPRNVVHPLAPHHAVRSSVQYTTVPWDAFAMGCIALGSRVHRTGSKGDVAE